MTRGGGRYPRRAGYIRRRHGVGAKIAVEGAGVDHVIKSAGVGIHCGGGGSICRREPRIGRSRLRIDGEGNLYVLDSEDEDSGMEVAADVVREATEGATNRNRAGRYNMPVEGHPMVDADGAVVKDLPPKGPPLLVRDGPSLMPTDKAEDMDMAPEVAARLKKMLANLDPIYHDVLDLAQKHQN